MSSPLRTIRHSLAYRWARRAIARNDLAPLLEGISNEAISPSYDDLWALYRQVRKQKPNLVLEYGSGCSTVIIARALADNGSGHLVSVDAQTEWLQHTRKMIPTSLATYVEMKTLVPATRMLPLRPPMASGEPGSQSTMAVLSQCHTELHDLRPDLIYLDGPAPGIPSDFSVDGTSLTPVVLDLLDMEANLNKGTVVIVDGRGMNCSILRANLRRRWSFQSTLRGATVFTLIV
jgi:hypothetical protein